MLTRNQLLAVFPQALNPDVLVPAINDAWAMFGISSRNARAGFFGLVANETGGLRQIGREDMRYSAERAFELFPKARAHPEITRDRCVRGQRAFASWIYADLYGNGDEASEDGWDYRGGGMLQLTFRSAYQACGDAIGFDLVGKPDLIVDPQVAALSAGWFVARYKPQVLAALNSPSESDFLAGGKLVGWTDPAGTGRRLYYRSLALAALDGADAPDAPAPVLLHTGSSGAAVERLQRALGITVDGSYGKATEDAVRSFQRRAWPTNPYEWDGVAGSKTLKALGLVA